MLLQIVRRLLPSPINEPSVHLGLRRHQTLEFRVQDISPAPRYGGGGSARFDLPIKVRPTTSTPLPCFADRRRGSHK
jgi:hypothetical protein